MLFVKPESVAQALERVSQGAVALAGGTILGPKIIRGESAPSTLVSIGQLDEFRRLEFQNGHLEIGAAVTLQQLASALEGEAPAMAKACASVGNPHVRNVATIGGNIASRLPGADLVPALLVLDAEVVHRGADGQKTESISQLIEKEQTPGDLIASIRIAGKTDQRSGFSKFAWRQASGKTIVNVAAAVRLKDSVIAAPRLAVGAVGHHARRLTESERMLAGSVPTRDFVDKVARLASGEAVFDISSTLSEKYRRGLIEAGVRELLTELSANWPWTTVIRK